MKTKTLITRLIYTLFLSFLISTNFGCAAILDAELNGLEPIPFTKEGLIDLNELAKRKERFEQNADNINFYPRNLAGVSAGFGLNSVEGESETSFCIGGEYSYRLSQDNYNRASYVNLFANYGSQSSDQIDQNTLSAGVGYTLFDRITSNAEVDLTYGVKAFYETGSYESFGFEEDITGYGAQLLIGANYNVNDNFAVGVTVPFLSYSQRTFEYDGGEVDVSNTWLGLNKDNMVMAYARFGF